MWKQGAARFVGLLRLPRSVAAETQTVIVHSQNPLEYTLKTQELFRKKNIQGEIVFSTVPCTKRTYQSFLTELATQGMLNSQTKDERFFYRISSMLWWGNSEYLFSSERRKALNSDLKRIGREWSKKKKYRTPFASLCRPNEKRLYFFVFLIHLNFPRLVRYIPTTLLLLQARCR